jgi:hypothetical protein
MGRWQFRIRMVERRMILVAVAAIVVVSLVLQRRASEKAKQSRDPAVKPASFRQKAGNILQVIGDLFDQRFG